MSANDISPVRYLEVDDPRLPRRADKALRDKLEGLKITVLSGQLNHDEYKFYTGQIAGIQFALDEIKQIIEEL